jgi:hypothetical protein
MPKKSDLFSPAPQKESAMFESAKDFLDEHRWHEWLPNGNVISGTGKGENLKTAVTTVSGDMALVYFSNNSFTRVRNILDGDAEAYWFYPRSGQIVKSQNYKQNESRMEAPPSKWEDAILVLRVIS